MDKQKQLRIRLSGGEIEEIVRAYIEKTMKEDGYELYSSNIEDGNYWPDMFYLGVVIKGEQ